MTLATIHLCLRLNTIDVLDRLLEARDFGLKDYIQPLHNELLAVYLSAERYGYSTLHYSVLSVCSRIKYAGLGITFEAAVYTSIGLCIKERSLE